MKKPLVSSILFSVMLLNAYAQDYNVSPGMEGRDNEFRHIASRPKAIITEELLKKTPDEFRKHPDFGILPLNAPCTDCVELLEKRSATKRYYMINGTNGSQFCEQTAYGIINYQDENGDYREKDIHVYATNDSKIYASNQQEEPVIIDLKANQVVIKGIYNHVIRFNRGLELWGVDSVGKEEFLSGADWNHATVGSDGLQISNIFKGIHLEALALSGSVKTNFLIESYASSYAKYKWLMIKDNISTGMAHHIQFAGIEDKNGLYDCDVDIIAPGNSLIAKIHQGSIYDDSRNHTHPLYYKYENDQFKMYIDGSYLKNSSIDYPVTVDPLITSGNTLAQATILGSQYNSNCSFTNSCDYTLTVNSPANATITDITADFSYSATGECLKRDGAIRIGYLGCLAPHQTGYYYYCAISGGYGNTQGTCNVSNASIFPSIQSCIPAPACASYPMPFVFKFYRRCKGRSGCAANCINAASPWTINVYGKTLETLSDTATGSGTTTIISDCLAHTVLNPNPLFGVGPYTFNWSQGGATTSTLAVSPVDSTKVITCDVTDHCGVVRVATFTVSPGPSFPSALPLPTQNITCNSVSTLTPIYNSDSPIINYQWMGPGIIGPNNTPGVTIGQAGNYVVTFTNTLGCIGHASYYASGSNAPVTASVLSRTISCHSPTASITPVFNPSGDLSYNWTTVTGNIKGPVDQGGITATKAGVYKVVFTNTLTSCRDSANYIVTSDMATPVISGTRQLALTCINPTINIIPDYSPSTDLSYHWSGPGLNPPLTTDRITVFQSGSYTVNASGANGCKATAIYTVDNQVQAVTASFSPLQENGIAPLVINFTNQSLNANTYRWNFGDGNISSEYNPSNTYSIPGTYTLALIASIGTCSNIAYGTVTVEDDPDVEIPNVFTPNGDQTNDLFYVKVKGKPDIDLIIYNRWGQKVYEASGKQAIWDGTETNHRKAVDGTYFYVITLTFDNDKQLKKNGFLNLYR